MWTRCLGGFSVMWVTKLLIFPVEIRIFCPKTTKFGPKLAFLVNLGQAMQVYSVPCWWVGWWLWRAGCISQDTYFLEHILAFVTFGSCFLLTATVAFPPLTGNCGTSDRQCKLGPSIGNSLSRDNPDWQIAANLCNCLLSDIFTTLSFVKILSKLNSGETRQLSTLVVNRNWTKHKF